MPTFIDVLLLLLMLILLVRKKDYEVVTVSSTFESKRLTRLQFHLTLTSTLNLFSDPPKTKLRII